MLRVRRSRIILVLAVFTLFLLFHFKSIPERWSSDRVVGGHSDATFVMDTRPAQGNTPEEIQKEAHRLAGVKDPAAVPTDRENYLRPAAAATTAVTTKGAKSATATEKANPKGSLLADSGLSFDTHQPPEVPAATGAAATLAATPAAAAKIIAGDEADDGLDELGVELLSARIHWKKVPEHFPVPKDQVIKLPVGKEKRLPKIQHSFKDETSMEKANREKKLARVKAAFKKSWDGYTKHAWMHDELQPVSGGYRDPFCGWAATLVDSLDSLLILGMENEFRHALEALATIDFTTTSRREIPLFETVIRYLGGLLSAHDLDGGKNKIILDKAVQLAEVLMGAFDTPNRMPQTFYQWMPIFAREPKRARTRVVNAEIGSLSMEFTRLAQLTGNDKYYDAIARITNEFEVWQDKTKIPGLWPLDIDASGCKKPSRLLDSAWKQKLMNGNPKLAAENERGDLVPMHGNPDVTIVAKAPPRAKPTPADKLEPMSYDVKKGKIQNWGGEAEDLPIVRPDAPADKTTKEADGGRFSRRQLENIKQAASVDDIEALESEQTVPLGISTFAPARGEVKTDIKVDCESQGLASPPGSTLEDFTFAGGVDSTYEYLPKQYLLLGGQASQYKSMYEKAISAANKYLLFRPMTPTSEDILVLGGGKAADHVDKPGNLKLKPDLSHLLCFAGGMYGLGAKLFDRPEDLELGKKMTDACVWAYNMTTSGIMPEDFTLIKCDDMQHCPWNQTKWEYTIDSAPEQRISDGLIAIQQAKEMKAGRTRPLRSEPESPLEPNVEASSSSAAAADASGGQRQKRQLPDVDSGASNFGGTSANRPGKPGRAPVTPTSTTSSAGDDDDDFSAPMKQKEYVKFMTDLQQLPDGVPHMASTKYILRPEAIESVFYMYRITGDPTWRDKGWRMFEAIEKATDTTWGASAISNVMDDEKTMYRLNEMESFWLAETLKYFYLLFSTEDVISLDEYVLNTEAHPFKRPVPKTA